MSTLLEEMTNLLSGDAMTKLSSTIGTDPVATGKAVNAGIQALLGAMAAKTKEAGGTQALLGLLNSDAAKQNGVSDGSLLDNLGGLLGGPFGFGGMEILQTLFGGGLAGVEQKVGKVSGLDSGVIGRLLPILAPIVLGFLGKQVSTGAVAPDGIGKFLSDQMGLMRSSAPGLLGFLEKIDANDDGSIVDDLGRLFGKLTGRQG
jgi:hypothetical protein